MRPISLVLAMLLCLGATSAPAAARYPGPGPAGSAPPPAPSVPGELLVRFAPRTPDAARDEAARAIGAQRRERLQVPGWELLEVAPTRRLSSVAEAALDLATVTAAEPNVLYRPYATPNDPDFVQQWAYDNVGQNVNGVRGTFDADIDGPEAWDLASGSPSVVVAVVDTGIDYMHPDISDRLWTNPGETGLGRETNGIDDDANGYVDDWRGWDWVGSDNAPQDTVGHGTHTAGIVGAHGDNLIGGTGTSWDVDLMPLRAAGEGGGTTAALSQAFTYAAAKGARVVNVSLGGPFRSQLMADAIANAPATLFVAAAGNGGDDSVGDDNDSASFPEYPCNFPNANVLCVTATDHNDAVPFFANYGSTSVDLGAPGRNIRSTVPPVIVRYSENFESDISSRWVTGGTNNTWGRAVDSVGGYLADSPGGNYASNTDSWVRTASPIDLTGTYGCDLRYAFKLEMATDDRFLIEASTDLTTWTRLRAWTGSTEGKWRGSEEDLLALEGASSIYLRFRVTSNALLNADGVGVDDVSVHCISNARNGSTSGHFDGTSMSAPFVAGTAALGWAIRPDATVAQIREALLRGVDVKPSLAGRTVTGGRLNAYATLHLLETGTLPPTTTATPTQTTAPSSSSASPEPSPEPSVGTTSDPSPADTPPAPSLEPTPSPTPSPAPEPSPTPSPSASPTPTPSPSPTSSPTPTPTEGPTVTPSPTATGPSAATSVVEISFSVSKSRTRVQVNGDVAPPHGGDLLTVTLARRRAGGGWKPVRSTLAVLRAGTDLDGDGEQESRFQARLRRVEGKRCRVKVLFRGDGDHPREAVARRIRC